MQSRHIDLHYVPGTRKSGGKAMTKASNMADFTFLFFLFP